VERSDPFGDEGGNERGNDETDALGVPLPPPEARAWRHPSELAAGRPALMPAPPDRTVVVSRLPVALLAGAASALAIAALLGALLPLAGRQQAGRASEEASAALGFPTSTIRVVATLAVASKAPTGVVELVALTSSGERRGYATVVNGALVTTAAAVDGASSVYVRGAQGQHIGAVVVDVSRDGVAVLKPDTVVAAPAAIGAAADLDAGDTVMVMSNGALHAGELQTVGETTRTAAGDKLDFLLRADVSDNTMEGAPLLDTHGSSSGCARMTSMAKWSASRSSWRRRSRVA
jgi:hypothetical protein